MVKAQIMRMDWSNKLDPICTVVLTNQDNVVRLLRMKLKDVPSRLLARF